MSRTAVALSIEFSSEEALRHFALWLCESGEQSYWDWMAYREAEEKGPITATSFHYHGPLPLKPDADGDDFVADNTIRTTCGRLAAADVAEGVRDGE